MEAVFYLILERWREEGWAQVDELAGEPAEVDKRSVVRLVGSHDLALSVLLDMLRSRDDSIRFDGDEGTAGPEAEA